MPLDAIAALAPQTPWLQTLMGLAVLAAAAALANMVVKQVILRIVARMLNGLALSIDAKDAGPIVGRLANVVPAIVIARGVVSVPHLPPAVETVTPTIPSTIEAAALCKMADRGQITGGELDGPLAFDNAISPEAARIKGIKSPVAGEAQILVVPDLEAGNMLAKNLTFLSHADAAGIVLGARVPIILTSRADHVRTRLASCAVAALYRHSQLAKQPIRA